MALGRGNDRKGAPVPRKQGVRVVGPSGDRQALGKGRNTGPIGGVGAGYGPPGSNRPLGRFYS